MLKVLLAILIIADLAVLALLIVGVIASINAGGGSVLFPGLGLVVALPLVLGVVFVFEMILVGITLIVYRFIGNGANSLN